MLTISDEVHWEPVEVPRKPSRLTREAKGLTKEE
jgi:hypothetical protein